MTNHDCYHCDIIGLVLFEQICQFLTLELSSWVGALIYDNFCVYGTKSLQSNETAGTKRMVENILIWIKLLTMWYNGSSQTLSSIRILWRACSCADGQAHLMSDWVGLGWAKEFACLKFSGSAGNVISGMTLSEPLHRQYVCVYTYTYEYIYMGTICA